MIVRKKLCCAASTIAMVAAISPAYAQSARAPVRTDAVQAKPQPTESQAQARSPEDIVVTARRVEERLQDVPVAVTALRGETLRNMSITELRGLAAVSPGLVIKNSSNDSNSALVALRGQWPSGVLISLDSSVGLYVDGYNNPRAQGFRAALIDINRVEVLRGPQGTLYGRNTTGGAISIITNSPTDKFGGSIQLRAGNYDALNAVAVLNVPLTDGLGIRIAAQRGRSSGYAHDGNGRNLADENSTYVRGKIRLEQGRFTAELYADYSRFLNGGPVSRLSGLTAYTTPIGGLATREVAQELGLTQDAAGWAAALQALQPYVYSLHAPNTTSAFANSGRGQFYTFEGYSGGLDMKYDFSDNISVRSLTGYRHFNRVNQVDFDGTPFDILDILFRGRDEFFSQETQLLGHFGPVRFVGGIYYSHEKGLDANSARSTRALAVAAGRPPWDTQGGLVTNESIAGYLQANWAITSALTLTLGGRYTSDTRSAVLIRNNNQAYLGLPLPLGNVSGCEVPAALLDSPANCRGSLRKTFSAPSWLASLDYHLNRDVMVYAKAARGYRTGGQNIRATTLASVVPFGPETIYEYEVGMKGDFFDRLLRLNLALYHDDYSNIQRVSAVVVGGVTSAPISNAASARINGVEVEAVLHPVTGVTLGANLAYTHARYVKFVDASGDRSKEDWPTPDWTYSLMARYERHVGAGRLAFQGDLQGQSRQNLYPANSRQQIDVRQPSYALLNGRVSYRLDSGLEFAVFGRNVLDKRYADAGLANEGLGVNLITIGAPRTVGVEMNYSF